MGQWGRRARRNNISGAGSVGTEDRTRPQTGVPPKPMTMTNVAIRLSQSYINSLEAIYNTSIEMQSQMQDLVDAGGSWPELKPIQARLDTFVKASTDLEVMKEEIQRLQVVHAHHPAEADASGRELIGDLLLQGIPYLKTHLEDFQAELKTFDSARAATVNLDNFSGVEREDHEMFFKILDQNMAAIREGIDHEINALDAAMALAKKEMITAAKPHAETVSKDAEAPPSRRKR